jgi:hypothetical protein
LKFGPTAQAASKPVVTTATHAATPAVLDRGCFMV